MNKQQQPDSGINDTPAHSSGVPSFNLLGFTVPDKNWRKISILENWSNRKMQEIKGQICSSLIPLYTIHPPTVHMCYKFQSSRPHSSWEKCDKNFLCLKICEKEKQKQNKGNKSSSPIPVYTIHPSIFYMCNKFQPSRPHSSWEKCDEKFSCLKTGEKDNWKIKGRISSSSPIPVYTIHLSTVHVCTKFQPSRPHSSWEKCDKNFQCLKIGEKEKWRNKGTKMQKLLFVCLCWDFTAQATTRSCWAGQLIVALFLGRLRPS